MKFLVDAQLPRRLAQQLGAAGHDAVHTLDLPRGNRTTDNDIVALAERDDRVVVTKDDDFVHSFMVERRPGRLLLVATGNIANTELEQLFQSSLETIVEAFGSYRFIELTRNALVVHE